MDVHDAHLTAIVAASPEAIVSTDRDGAIVAWNGAAERLFGYTAAEMVGMPSPVLEADERQAIHARFEAGETVAHVERAHRTKSGELVDVAITVSPVREAGGALLGSVMTAHDAGARRHAQKMEALGRIAGGVAHDFNNLLTVILTYAHVVLEGMSPEEPLHTDVVEIERAASRAASLTRQLLAFTRRESQTPQPTELDAVLRDLERMLRRVLGEDIELVLSLRASDAVVRIDPGQLEQVVMNLALNARDAMPSGGRLMIVTSSHGARVHLDVIDTGIGMDAETRRRVFEPFFTTKGRGRGTGLGLPIAAGIVERAGGVLTVDSSLGAGATFHIELPTSDDPIAGVRDLARVRTRERAHGSETVLLVEDDDLVRSTIRTALERQGYTVLDARSGEQALSIAADHRGVLDVLVTDVVMPRMSGPQLADELVSRFPRLGVLFITGYSDESIRRHADARALHYLAKPVRPSVLGQKIRELLD